MASVAYEQILEVQSLDLRLTQLRHRLATHPSRAELAAADQRLAAAGEQLQEIAGRIHELDRTQKRLTDEVETIEAKRSRVDEKLYGGTVTASKDLLALQDEAASLLARQRSLEDDQLAIMESLEEVGDEQTGAEKARAEADDARLRAATGLAEATEEIEAEIAEVEASRAACAGAANGELLAHYEELSPQFDGVAVARFVDGRCDGCHMQLSAMAADRLAKAPENAVVTCEECGRLLVR